MGMIYSFSQNQLKVLLKGCGYSKVAGINIDSESLDNSIVLTALNELTRAGVVLSSQERFLVVDSVRDIVCTLGKADEYIVLHSNDASLPDKCMFLSDKILVCSSRQKDSTHIQTEFFECGELFDELTDEGYFAIDTSDVQVEEKALEKFEQEIFEGVDPNMPLNESSAVLFSMEEITSEGQLLRYMRVVAYYFYTYIVFYDGEQLVRDVYTGDSARKYFEKMINI